MKLSHVEKGGQWTIRFQKPLFLINKFMGRPKSQLELPEMYLTRFQFEEVVETGTGDTVDGVKVVENKMLESKDDIFDEGAKVVECKMLESK